MQDQSVPENSLPAFAAAAKAGYGIELDVQFTKDRKVLVFHDDTLDRMTGTHGWVRDFTLEQIEAMPLKGTAQRAPLFTEVLKTVDARVPIIVEIKSRREYPAEYRDALCTAALEQARASGCTFCVESFDPRVVRWVKKNAPDILRGQLADCTAGYKGSGSNWLSAFVMSHCFGNLLARPQFLAWCPAKRNLFVRAIAKMGAMMVYWTALPQDDAARLQRENDAVIFQWYRPESRWSAEPRA